MLSSESMWAPNHVTCAVVSPVISTFTPQHVVYLSDCLNERKKKGAIVPVSLCLTSPKFLTELLACDDANPKNRDLFSGPCCAVEGHLYMRSKPMSCDTSDFPSKADSSWKMSRFF